MKTTTDAAEPALDTVLRRLTVGIPSWIIHGLPYATIERLAGAGPRHGSSASTWLTCAARGVTTPKA